MISELLRRLFKWLIDQFGNLGLLNLILLWFTLGSAGLGLNVLIKGLPSGFISMVITIGILMAWLFTFTRLRAWSFGLIGTLLGLFGLMLTVGGIGTPIAQVLSSLIPILKQLILGRSADFSTLVAAWESLDISLMEIIARFGNWLRGIGNGTQIIDPLVTSLVWGMALWAMIFWALWWVQRRGSVMPGLLPVTAVLGYGMYLSNTWKGGVWLVLMSGGILLLQASDTYRISSARWVRRHLDQVEIEPMLILSVVLLTGGMMLSGGILPSIPIHEFFESINKKPPQSGETRVVSQSERPGAASDIMSLTEVHLLGPGPHLAQNPVMFITVEGYIPDDISEYVSNVPQPTIRYYWRAQTFDVYSGHGWVAKTAQVDEIPANQSLLSSLSAPALAENYQLVTQHVTLVRTGSGAIFTTGEFVQLDQPALVLWNTSGDFIAARTDAEVYTAVSRMPSVSVEQLRSAGVDYPPAILRYLDLPDELPLRVRNLALDLTVSQPTPYDKAAILEAYLRQFTYSLDVPGPPANRDAVDYFLFDLKQGYCDYSASAMAVMARAVGLPARLVLGYSSGVYDEVEKQFVVRANNAHSWVEIYFPNIGWVGFEPTPTQPLPNRPGQEVDSSQTIYLPSPGQKTPFSIRIERIGLTRLLGALLAIVAILIFFFSLPIERWWLSLLSIDRALKYIYRRLYRRGYSLGIQPDPSRTPNDFSVALSTAMERTTKKEKRVALVSRLRTDLHWLTDLYDQLLFSERDLREEDKQEAIRAWVRLRRGLGKIRR